MSKNIKLPEFAVFLRALDPQSPAETDSDTGSATDLDSLLAQLEDSDCDDNVPPTPQRDYAQILEDIQDSVKEFEHDIAYSEPDCGYSDISSPPRIDRATSPVSHLQDDSKQFEHVIIEPNTSERQYTWHHSSPEDYEKKPPTDLLDVTPPGSPRRTLPEHNDSSIRKLLQCNPRSSIDLLDSDSIDHTDPTVDSANADHDQDCGPPPPLFATFSNIPTFFIPYHPVSYIIHISVYPKSATGTLYERISGNVCARSTLCDEQVFMVYRLDDDKGLDYIVRYLTSSLLVTIVMHNEVFKYKVDFKRIPIKVVTCDGKSLEYTY